MAKTPFPPKKKRELLKEKSQEIPEFEDTADGDLPEPGQHKIFKLDHIQAMNMKHKNRDIKKIFKGMNLGFANKVGMQHQ